MERLILPDSEPGATLERHGVCHCLLTGHDGGTSDLDFMVAPADLVRLPAALADLARVGGARLVQAVTHEHGATWHVLARRQGASLACLQLDGCTDYRRAGRTWLSAAALLARRWRDARGRWLPAPADAFAYYLIKKIDKGSLSDAQGRQLQDCLAQDPEGCGLRLRALFPEPAAARIALALRAADWTALRGQLPTLRRDLRRHVPAGPRSLPDRLRHGLLRLRRLRFPTGLTVVVLGPDGCGKSTALAHLSVALAPVFRRVVRQHLFWPLRGATVAHGMPGTPPATVIPPYAAPPRGLPGSLAKLGWFWLRALLGEWLHVAPARWRSTLVLFDRHYPDLAIDPLRYRYAGPLWLARALGRLLPAPDLVLVFDAPATVLQARTTELTPPQSGRQRAAYRAWLARHPAAYCIDASTSPERVAEAALERVLEHLEQRCRRRLGLPAVAPAVAWGRAP